ncbi:L,D-transpeptidase family protein [Pseudomonas sp. NPDC007930]|uniref:L,D-transpeptidase family protein n=1 Tax=Pseudomonas sp. NPDC007930 TaxID=3364417 RepID=UPI0036E01FD4
MRVLFASVGLLFALAAAPAAEAAFTTTIITRPVAPGAPAPAPAQAVPLPNASGRLIDKIVVVKSSRELQLMSGGVMMKAYRVSLGKQPRGAKEREGDRRTPEGFYWVDWRKVSDKFNLAMHISYPNVADAARARRDGVNPGSMIMIHGTPIDEDYPEWYFASLDWTDGCIALKNDDMREIWGLVKDGTLVEIRP